MAKSVYTDEYKAFLRSLIAARKAARLTQQTLAARLKPKRHQSFVSKYERGERRLDVVEFIAFSRAIGTHPHAVITEIERMTKGSRKRKT